MVKNFLLAAIFTLIGIFNSDLFAQNKTTSGTVADSVSGQNISVSGTIKNKAGAPIAGSFVNIKGTRGGGAVADDDGVFHLNRVPENSILLISAVGYSTKELLASPEYLNIILDSASADLNEVVVVAYGRQVKTNVTGSVVSISGDKVENQPFTSLDKMLQGNAAGLQSTSGSGAPGSATDIRIRGIGSINASSSPLWVIDGAIATTGDLTSATTTANALAGLNPDDIESISVLKDAAATAIYGSKGANGVILVTTKKGKSGKTKVNFSTENGKESIAFKNNRVAPLNTTQYIKLYQQALINSGEDSADVSDPYNDLGIYPNVNTDWLKLVTQTGNQNQVNLSISGGNEKTQFYSSAGYFNQDGTTIATNFKRYNGSLSVTHKANDKFSFAAGVNGSSSLQHSPSNGGTFANPVLNAMFLLPWYAPYNSDGSLRYGDNDTTGEFAFGSGVFNPLAIAKFEYTNTRQINLRGYVSGDYNILKNLKFTSRYSAEYLTIQEDLYWSPFYGDGYQTASSVTGYAFASNRRVFDWTWSNLLDYKANLNQAKDFYLDVLAGTEAYKYNNYIIQAQGQGFPLTDQLNYLASITTYGQPYSLPDFNATSSYLSNATLNYKDKYVLTGSFRRDGSSVFGANHKWANFYSVGATWNINEENFIKDLPWINLLKLRTSYGQNGNSLGFGEYQSLALYSYGYNYAGQPGDAPTNVGNPDLTWEKNKEFNIGLDFALFANRFSGTFEYYTRTTSDLLLDVPLSATSGFSGGQLMNVGSMRNRGIEITLSGKPVQTKDFVWNVAFNITHNQNRVLALYKNTPIPYNTRFQIAPGHDMLEYYLRNWKGVDPANGNPVWYTNGKDTATTSTVSQAAIDYTGKSASPKWYGSFTNTFTYKEFTLSGMFYYNFGNYFYDTWATYYNSDGAYLGSTNQSANMLRAWQKPGDITDVPRQVWGGNRNSNATGTRFLYSDRYIRLRDVQLAYQIPQKWLGNTKISNLTVYVHGTNLWTLGTDKNLPYDPEQGINVLTNLNVYIPKTITFGIKAGL